MYKKLRNILNLLPRRTRLLFYFYTILRSGLGFLDLFAILLMGLLIARTSANLGLSISFSFFNLFTGLDLVSLSALVLFLFVLKSMLSVFVMRTMNLHLAKAEADASRNLFKNILNSDFNSISKFSKQDITYGVGSSATASIVNLLSTVSTIVSESAMLLVILVAFSYVDLTLTIFIALYFLFIGYFLNRFIGKLSHKAGSETAVQSVLVHQVVQDSLGASREIKTLKKVEAFVNKFYEPKRKHSHAVASISYLTSLPRFIVEPALMIGAVMLAGFSLNTDGGLATLGIFLTGGLRIMAAMLPLQSALGIVRQLLAMSEKFIELNSKFIPFNGESSVINSLEIRLNKGNIGPVSIQIHNLEFKYEGNLPAAINSVNISIASGSLVAIVGPSGSGKSTLADILVGGLMPTSGKINFYSDRGKLINFGDFRIGYVPQNPGIVSGTILENITFETDLNQINFDALEAALSLSHLKSVIEGLPNGINSRVGEQLDDLSGGQFQRIGLARALYSQPNLLVLDEATSALDMETEGAIKETLDSLKGQVTTLVIAHRLSTVSSADQVLVLENGQIQDFGTFKELKLRNSVVSRYVELSNLNQD